MLFQFPNPSTLNPQPSTLYWLSHPYGVHPSLPRHLLPFVTCALCSAVWPSLASSEAWCTSQVAWAAEVGSGWYRLVPFSGLRQGATRLHRGARPHRLKPSHTVCNQPPSIVCSLSTLSTSTPYEAHSHCLQSMKSSHTVNVPPRPFADHPHGMYPSSIVCCHTIRFGHRVIGCAHRVTL